jgi:hypothetical protein
MQNNRSSNWLFFYHLVFLYEVNTKEKINENLDWCETGDTTVSILS